MVDQVIGFPARFSEFGPSAGRAPAARRMVLVTIAALLVFAPLILASVTELEINRGTLALADLNLKGIARAHDSEITSLTFGDKSLVTSSHDGTVKFWNLDTGELKRTALFAALDPSVSPSTSQSNDLVTASPLAVAIGKDQKLIAMTNYGAAFEDDAGRLVVGLEGKSARSTGYTVARVNQSGQAISRNWLPRSRETAPFVALALPGTKDSYAIGESDGSVAIETDAANSRSLSTAGLRMVPPPGSPRHTSAVTALAVTSDGGTLASTSEDGSVILWTVRAGKIAAGQAVTSTSTITSSTTLVGHASGLKFASFGPDNSAVVTAADDKTVRVWAADNGTQTGVQLLGQNVLGLAAGTGDLRVATASGDPNVVQIHDVGSGSVISTLRGHTGRVTFVAFSSDSGLIATASADKTARIWQSATAIPVATLAGHDGPINLVSFSPDGSHVVTASSDNTARVWSVPAGKVSAVLRHRSPVLSAAFSQDGRRIATGSQDGTARIWDAASGSLLITLFGHAGAIESVAFNRAGDLIATGSADNTARIWDAGSGSALAILSGHRAAVAGVAFSSDGTTVVTASADKTARLWQTGNMLSKSIAARCTNCTSVSFSTDRNRFISAGGSGEFQIWNATNGELVRAMRQDAAINVARLTSDGRIAITAGDDGVARLWDVDRGVAMAAIRGHDEAIVQAELTPDQERLVTAARDGSVRLTSLAQARVLNDPIWRYRQWAGDTVTSMRSGVERLTARLMPAERNTSTTWSFPSTPADQVPRPSDEAPPAKGGDANASLSPDGLLPLVPRQSGDDPGLNCSVANLEPIAQMICRDSEMARANGELQQLFNQARTLQQDPSALLKEQLAWISKRNQQCHIPQNGSLNDMDLRRLKSCYMDLTLARIGELKLLPDSPGPKAGISVEGKTIRVAFVVGEWKYQNVPELACSARDASAMAQALKQAGFEVQLLTNPDLLDFKRGIRKFEEAADQADIALIYYSGHGLEIGGTNYLIPVDARLASDRDADDEAIPLDRLLTSVDGARRLRLIILDAARDNPFSIKMRNKTRSVERGLGKIEPRTSDTLIAFAAKAGTTASDCDASGSAYTTALINNLFIPNLDVRLAFGRIRDLVMKKTGGRQEPFVYGSLGGNNISLVQTTGATQDTTPLDDVRRDYELVDRIGTQRAWEAFLASHPTGFYSDLARAQVERLAQSSDKSGKKEQK
jgi:WD40 repeat protein/uncharacterized protein YecT (DUF1311 family)